MTKAFDQIMDGPDDAPAFAEGKGNADRRVHTIEVVDVKEIREKTGLSQPEFSRTFMVPVGTLRNWEQGHRQPDGPARALMQIIDKNPKEAMRALHEK